MKKEQIFEHMLTVNGRWTVDYYKGIMNNKAAMKIVDAVGWKEFAKEFVEWRDNKQI